MDNIQEILNKLHEQDGANWKQIVDFPNYAVSDNGEIYSLCRNKKVTLYANSAGYLRACLCRDGKNHQKRVHRLVADAFIPNPEGFDTVDHINCDKLDNRAVNLQWMTRVDNANKSNIARGFVVGKWFSVYRNGECVGRWNNQCEAARILGVYRSNLRACLRGEHKQACGYTFVYDD